MLNETVLRPCSTAFLLLATCLFVPICSSAGEQMPAPVEQAGESEGDQERFELEVLSLISTINQVHEINAGQFSIQSASRSGLEAQIAP